MNQKLELVKNVAIGDAYGAGFEFEDFGIVDRENTLLQYHQHSRHKIAPGCYTDDTQMSLAIAEVLISDDPWTPEVLAQKFVDVFKRDPRVGYAGRFYDFLQKTQDGDEFLANIIPTSDKGGAAMRTVPLGILRDTGELIDKARTHAAITHDTKEGVDSAIAASLVSHFFVHNVDDKSKLPDFLDKYIPSTNYQWSDEWQGEVPSAGIPTVKAVVTVVSRNDSLSALLKDCIAFKGDVDTVAAIALGAASASKSFVRDLPEFLERELEDGIYGRQYIEQIDSDLSELFKRF